MRLDGGPEKIADYFGITGLVSEAKRRHINKLESTRLLDGGVLSNLPVDAFVEPFPGVPTMVVPLIDNGQLPEYRSSKTWSGLGRDIQSVIDAMRAQRDLDALKRVRRNPDVPLRVLGIDPGNISWLNFAMPEDEKAKLFECGVRCAHQFVFGRS